MDWGMGPKGCVSSVNQTFWWEIQMTCDSGFKGYLSKYVVQSYMILNTRGKSKIDSWKIVNFTSMLGQKEHIL